MSDTLSAAEETKVLGILKRASAMVEAGESPNSAIIKLAKEESVGPGMIDTLCRTFNTGRQLAQWRANDNVLDKLAAFAIADADVVRAAVYPKAETRKEASLRHEVSAEYLRPPDWIPDMRKSAALDRELPATAMTKTAECGFVAEHRGVGLLKGYAKLDKVKLARDEARREASRLEDVMRVKVAALVDYFRQSPADRMAFAQVEHAARAYMGPRALDALKMAYEMARLREPTSDKAAIQKTAFDTESSPFTEVRDCVEAAFKVVEARLAYKAASDRVSEVEGEVLSPFSVSGPSSTLGPAGGSLVDSSEKGAVLGFAAGTAMGNAAATMMGNYPKSKGDLIEDEWLDLESPAHQNALRKIKAHAMLNSMLTDEDDPISGSDPDKVLSAFNEISQTAPRAADNPAILRPLLRKRLSGLTEPFEAKELVDIEKGLRDTKNIPPSTSLMASGPDDLLG